MQAMKKLGFTYETREGSSRAFVPAPEPPRPTLVWDEVNPRGLAANMANCAIQPHNKKRGRNGVIVKKGKRA